MEQKLGNTHQFFEEVFKKNYANLCRYAYSFLKDEEACEDLVQELFIKLWHDRPEIFSDKQIISYLHTAVKNNCISALRKKIQTISIEDNGSLNIVEVNTIDQDQEKELLYEKVFSAIEDLPPKCATIFKMHRLSGLSYKQIAEDLGISVKTVENQIGKAMKMLRNALNPEILSIFLFIMATQVLQ
jgi:RNA polymerase sigma-70 factor (ECF subfamily)